MIATPIAIPCARCGRRLDALPLPSDYVCPCGACYVIRPLDIEGLQGLAVLLERPLASPTPAVRCARCRITVGIGHIPDAGLFVTEAQGWSLLDHVGQRCPLCHDELPVPLDTTRAPHWLAFLGARES